MASETFKSPSSSKKQSSKRLKVKEAKKHAELQSKKAKPDDSQAEEVELHDSLAKDAELDDSYVEDGELDEFQAEEPKPNESLIEEAEKLALPISTEEVSFAKLGVIDVLCDACDRLGWKSPTIIQQEAIPLALQNRDVIGLAETGSGKTGAFALPILQNLMVAPQKLFALILTPTRELAYQIKEQFEALGKAIGVQCSVIVGGMDIKKQMEELRERPHIIIGTPGRLLDHLRKTKGFHLRDLKYLVMDEADRILNLDFEEEVNAILSELPPNIRTLLFSATMTSKVNKLQRVHLRDPVKVEASTKYQTVTKLKQFMLFVPYDEKALYLVYLLNEIGDRSVIIFCMTRSFTLRTTLILRTLGFDALPLFGKMDQNKRLGALNKFKCKNRSILLATDVASRGLDIPDVDFVINYDCPANAKDYIHRVGRTARAGKDGTAITLVDQYTVMYYTKVEQYLKTKLPCYPVVEEEVMVFKNSVMESIGFAEKEMLTLDFKGEKRRKKVFSDQKGDNSGKKSDHRKKVKRSNK